MPIVSLPMIHYRDFRQYRRIIDPSDGLRIAAIVDCIVQCPMCIHRAVSNAFIGLFVSFFLTVLRICLFVFRLRLPTSIFGSFRRRPVMAETIVNELVYSFLLPEVAKQKFRQRGYVILCITV